MVHVVSRVSGIAKEVRKSVGNSKVDPLVKTFFS